MKARRDNVLLSQRASAPHRLLRHHLVRAGPCAPGGAPGGPSLTLPPQPTPTSTPSRLAATRGSRLVKREYLKVNVVKTW